jgi:hypothetical protein
MQKHMAKDFACSLLNPGPRTQNPELSSAIVAWHQNVRSADEKKARKPFSFHRAKALF